MAVLDDRIKAEYELAETFRTVSGEGFTLPLEKDPDFKNDISRLDLTNSQQALRTRQYGDSETAGSGRHEHSARAKEERRTEQDLAMIRRATWEDANRYAQEMLDLIDRQMEQIRYEREQIERDQQAIQVQIQSLDTETHSLRHQQKELMEKIKEKEDDVREKESAAKAALNDYEAGYATFTPEIGERERKLKEETWNENRDLVKAQYEAKGLGAEFEILERKAFNKPIDPESYKLAVEKARAAGLSAQPDVIMMQNLPANHPLRQTMEGKWIIACDHAERVAIAQKEFYDFRTEEADVQLARIERRLKRIEEERQSLADRSEQNQERLQELARREEKIRKEREEVVAYQNWLNSNDVKNSWGSGKPRDPEDTTPKVKLDDFTQRMPPVMRNGYLDTGTACINPNSELGQQLIGEMAKVPENHMTPSLNYAAVKSMTSASKLFDGGIQWDQELSSGFNGSASPTPLLTSVPENAPAETTPAGPVNRDLQAKPPAPIT